MVDSTTAVVEKVLMCGSVIFKCLPTYVSAFGSNNGKNTLQYCSVGCILLSVISATLCSSRLNNLLVRNSLNGSLYVWMLPYIHLLNYLSEGEANSGSHVDSYFIQPILGQAQLITVFCLNIYIYMHDDLPETWNSITLILVMSNSALLLYLQLDWIHLAMVIFLSALFLVMVLNVFKAFPKTFSLGEGVIGCQAFTSALLWLAVSLEKLLNIEDEIELKSEKFPYDYLAMVASISLLLPVMLYASIPSKSASIKVFYISACLAITVTVCLTFQYAALKNSLLAIVDTDYKVFLLVYWLCIAAGSIMLVMLYNIKGWRVTSTDRKYFHLFAMMIFVPGTLMAPQLTKLASIGAFLLFVLVEFLRYTKLPPFGLIFDDTLRPFRDKQDAGSLVLTQIYLLSGFSLPLWLTPSSHISVVDARMFAGVISLGVGDSFASIIGSIFGSIRYPGSQKTVEGTAAAWLSMTLFSYLLYIPSAYEMCILSSMLLLVAVLESCTQQVDNLILPLYAYVMVTGV